MIAFSPLYSHTNTHTHTQDAMVNVALCTPNCSNKVVIKELIPDGTCCGDESCVFLSSVWVSGWGVVVNRGLSGVYFCAQILPPRMWTDS